MHPFRRWHQKAVGLCWAVGIEERGWTLRTDWQEVGAIMSDGSHSVIDKAWPRTIGLALLSMVLSVLVGILVPVDADTQSENNFQRVVLAAPRATATRRPVCVWASKPGNTMLVQHSADGDVAWLTAGTVPGEVEQLRAAPADASPRLLRGSMQGFGERGKQCGETRDHPFWYGRAITRPSKAHSSRGCRDLVLRGQACIAQFWCRLTALS